MMLCYIYLLQSRYAYLAAMTVFNYIRICRFYILTYFSVSNYDYALNVVFFLSRNF